MADKAQDIVNQILGSDRYRASKTFSDRVFADEPILRVGMTQSQKPKPKPARAALPSAYRKMRALARKRSRNSYRYGTGMAQLFYEQGKFMEAFEDDFAATGDFHLYFPTYNEMTDYELRSYFSWRTRLRAGEAPQTSVSFLFVHAYELLCGIGVEPGEAGYAELQRFRELYRGASPAFDAHLSRWSHDYVIFHGLSRELLVPEKGSFSLEAVSVLRQAEETLLSMGGTTWPDKPYEGLPSPEELLDSLCVLSRYRAEKSRFFREKREDAAIVCARVFARMVAHCRKRRKTDLVDGLFGTATKVSYAMFPSAVFWAPEQHPDTAYVAGPSERYECEHGFWWRILPCRRTETNRELGNLLHTIDARMRAAYGDAHPLKARTIPKYQSKFVDEEVGALLEQRAAEEAARIDIDRSALHHIRSAAARTREALLTDDERDSAPSGAAAPAPGASPEPASKPVEPHTPPAAPAMPSAMARTQPPASSATPPSPTAAGLGLTEEQVALVKALACGEEPQAADSLFVTLAVDAINEAFLDLVGDTVVEFEGERPELIADYADDVRDALGL